MSMHTCVIVVSFLFVFVTCFFFFFFFSSRRRHTRFDCDWSSDVCSSDLSPYRVNADLKYHPPTVYGFFYLGGGFAYVHAAGEGHGGGNVFAGWEGRRARPFKPFLEGKFVFSYTTSFNIEGGINFPL